MCSINVSVSRDRLLGFVSQESKLESNWDKLEIRPQIPTLKYHHRLPENKAWPGQKEVCAPITEWFRTKKKKKCLDLLSDTQFEID